MPRFVILCHQTAPDGVRPTHWDLMLESGDSLRTWALEQAPEEGLWIAAEGLPDHRLRYLDYEGPISGGRGAVTRWDRGLFVWRKESDCELVVQLSGQRLRALATLTRLAVDDQRWRVWFSAD